jgi:hypothetical protein
VEPLPAAAASAASSGGVIQDDTDAMKASGLDSRMASQSVWYDCGGVQGECVCGVGGWGGRCLGPKAALGSAGQTMGGDRLVKQLLFGQLSGTAPGPVAQGAWRSSV